MVGEVTYKALCDLGIKRIKTIPRDACRMMHQVLGKNGEPFGKS